MTAPIKVTSHTGQRGGIKTFSHEAVFDFPYQFHDVGTACCKYKNETSGKFQME